MDPDRAVTVVPIRDYIGIQSISWFLVFVEIVYLEEFISC